MTMTIPYKLGVRHKRSILRVRQILLLVVVLLLLGSTPVIFQVAHVGAPAHTYGATQEIPLGVAFLPEIPALATDEHSLGIAAGSSLPGLEPARLNAQLDGIQATGANWVRLDFDWSQIQPNSSSNYNWVSYDRVIAGISHRNMQVLGIIDYTPEWARPASCQSSNKCAPANPGQYANFAVALAQRYKAYIHYWEIWNEPNNPAFWQPTVSPEQYATLLKSTYTRLHQADPKAYVITAGLSPQPTTERSYAPYDFLQGMYAAGAKGYFDAVGDHPYTFPVSPTAMVDDAWTQMAAPNHSLRSLMLAQGDGTKKIWITEFGAPTNGPGPVATISNPNLNASPYVVDQLLQAKILTDALALYKTYDWAGPFFYYSYEDAGTDTSTNENFFGLVTSQRIHKPAYAVFRSSANEPL